MSQAGLIRIVHGPELAIDLYTHWGGSRECRMTVASVLAGNAGQSRKSDPPYLSRILMETMVEGADCKEKGYGIIPVSGSLLETHAPDVLLNPLRRVVWSERWGEIPIEGTNWNQLLETEIEEGSTDG